MRLTNREKIILAGFSIILIITAVVYFAYLPVYDALSVEKEALNENRALLESIEKNILPIDQQMQLIDNFRKKYEIMQKTLPPVLYQEDVLRRITTTLDENGILASEYTFELQSNIDDNTENTEALDKLLSSYGDTALDNISKSMVQARFAKEEEEKDTQTETWDSIVDTIDVSISLEGNYENIKKAILSFESMENVVLVSNLTVAKDVNFADTVRGTIEMRFPYYYDNETLDKLFWEYQSEFEKHYPFEYIVTGSEADPNRPVQRVPTIGSGNDAISSDIIEGLYDRAAEESKVVDYDFEVVMSPPTSIHMNYYISKSDNKSFSLGSERTSETMNITITESGGKYAFNYNTSLADFPGVNDYYTFTPNYEDGIYMTVVSSPRVGDDDTGMGTLNVYNKTSTPLKIFVKSDDEKLPRLVLGKQEGQVSVIHD